VLSNITRHKLARMVIGHFLLQLGGYLCFKMLLMWWVRVVREARNACIYCTNVRVVNSSYL